MNYDLLKKIAIGISASIALSATAQAAEIIHDSEHYVLLKQYKGQWAQQDAEIQEKLDALRKKYGKPPNIIHIMWDDTPVGEIGIPAVQKVRGWETPVMNKLAAEGINFMRMYTEPSCTPTRAAVMTGRHAVRNGMYNVGFPYEYGGLAADEVTIGEVLSKAGYATAFYGKSHLGDVESSYLSRQGFDEALWSPYNQVPSLYVPQAQLAILSAAVMFPEMFPDDPYDIDKGWRPNGYVWALEGTKGGPVREYGTPPNHDDYMQIEDEFYKRSMDFIDRSAKGDKPFFLALWPLATSFLGFPDRVTVTGSFLQEALARMDTRIGLIKQQLEELGIAENTLVVLMADNGPMTHDGPPGMVETLYAGGKGDYTEGGVRVPAFAWWPGVIEPGQIVGDIIHATDLFTTFATLGGATKYIPRDRVIDGVNQTALFLEGDTHSRRDYVHIYTGPILAATVKGRYKKHWAGAKPGLSGPEFYDLFSDPREASGKLLPMFPAKSMFNQMRTRHQLMIAKFPNKGQNRDYPFQNIENARPETIKASQPRVDPEDVPFDPREVIRDVPEWENTEASWGIGDSGK